MRCWCVPISAGGSLKTTLGDWTRRHPIEAFFCLGVIICFGTLFPALYFLPRDTTLGQVLGFYLAKIGVYSPVIAGIVVVRVIQPNRQRVPIARRLRISLPVWFIAVVVNIAGLKLTAPPSVPLAGLILLSLPVALLPAWVISSAFHGPNGVRQMLATLVKPKGNVVYYVVAFLTFPATHIIGSGMANIGDGRPWIPQVSQGVDLGITILITFCSVLLFSGGINEESGWRGFAQRRLQAKYSPLVTALVLWLCMVIWHIPNDIVQYEHGGYLLVRIALYPFITILFSWIYNRTGGSILAVAIFHSSMNSTNPLMGIFPVTTEGNVLLVGFAAAVVVFDRMWRKLPADHPAVYQDTAISSSAGSTAVPTTLNIMHSNTK